MGVLYSIAMFLLMLGILVFFHELGHFLAAKMLGMRVLEFAFNMGPRLFGIRVGETEYNVRAVPIGGFVRIAGMEIEDEVESKLTGALRDAGVENTNTLLEQQEADRPALSDFDPDSYNNRPVWQRFTVILAGPVFSFLLGWITLCLIGVVAGIPDRTQLGISDIVKGSVAEQVGLKTGDVITGIDGTPVTDYVDALKTIRGSAGKKLTLVIRDKDGKTKNIEATPRAEKDETTGEAIGRLGFAPDPITLSVRHTTLTESFTLGHEKTLMWFELMGKLVSSGAITKNVGGPVAIFKETASASKRGGPDPMFLVGQLSLSLGLFNLLPIPILDGGHLMLLILEAVRRRKLTASQTIRVQYTGLAILLTIFVLVMFKDVSVQFTRLK